MSGEVIGLIPAAGIASRLSSLPCSKEVFPIGFHMGSKDSEVRPKVACEFLLERLRIAGIRKTYIVIRKGKWDIPDYLGDGSVLGIHIAYLMMGLPYGSPYTLDQAWPFVQGARIALGFPDIIFEPSDAYSRLLIHLEATGADVVLGLFPSTKPHKMDMVETDAKGNVLNIDIKPKETALRYSWMIAVWTFEFTRFLHNYLERNCVHTASVSGVESEPETYMGDVIQAAVRAGLKVVSETFSSGFCVDLGTPEDLSRVMKDYDSGDGR